MVTAITLTPLGDGKTVTNISLALGLARLGKKVINTLRQPSMGCHWQALPRETRTSRTNGAARVRVGAPGAPF